MSPATSFTPFDSRLAIQAGSPLICKHQPAAAEPRSAFPRSAFFPPSVPAGSWSYKCLYREVLKLSQAFVPAGPDGRVHTRCRSQTSHPQGSPFFFCFSQLHFWVSLLFSVLNTEGGKELICGENCFLNFNISFFFFYLVRKKELKEFNVGAHKRFAFLSDCH